MNAQIFDRKHFAYMTADDVGVQREVLDLFRAQAVDWIARLSGNATDCDWASLAHTMKGSARGIGLPQLAAASEALEAAAKHGQELTSPRAQAHAALADVLAILDADNPPL